MMDSNPTITYGPWLPTCYLAHRGIYPLQTLIQKFRRRVKRDFGHGDVSKTYEYEWKEIPAEGI